ncbi:hypothetical protein [Candidatus Uabimicrobium amorphum]|uniref:Uncharacterized protein n=1 Tax=Uabimicrobium amorphum TaxID=2596890 RepID=A0A5S9IPM5_UABAM|nr:hypothetical protein [Candidatus Uabimicrobium amorphum]BBM85783.1 hypothetical protein UABAM_04161 [Candidatus Uabimicrobium amorphum]
MSFTKLCLTLLFALSCVVGAQDFNLEQNLPDSTLLVVSAPNAKAAVDAVMETGYAQLVCSEGMQQVIRPVWELLQPEISPMMQQFNAIVGMMPQDLLQMFQGEVSVAVVNFDPMQNPPVIDAVISISLAGNFDKGKEIIFTHLNNFMPGAPKMEIEGQEFVTVPQLPMPVYGGFIDKSFVIATSAERLSSLMAKKPQKTLIEDASYAKIRNRSNAALSLVHIKVRDIIEKVMPGERKHPLVDMLGVQDITSLGGSAGIHDGNFRYSFIVETTDNERKGLFNLVSDQPLSEDLFKDIPKTSVYYEVMSFDLMKFYMQIEQFVNMTPVAPMWRQIKSQVEQMLGISLQQDLLACFGKEAAMFIDMSGGIGSTITMAKMSDGERFVSTVKKVAETFPDVELRTTTYKEQTIHYLHLTKQVKPADDVRSAIAFVVATGMRCFFIKDNKMYLSNSILSLKRYLHGSQKEANGVDVKLAQGQTAYAYIDTTRGVRYLYNNIASAVESLTPFANLIPKNPVDFDSASLPIIEDFIKDVHPTVTSLTNNKNEIMLEMDGSILGGISSVIYFSFSTSYLLGIQAAMLLPALSNVSEKAKEVKSKSHLNQIGMCIEIYLLDFGRSVYYPASIEELYLEQLLVDNEVYLCPLGDPDAAKPGIVNSSFRTHYKWLFHQRLGIRNTTETIVAYSDELPDTVIILYQDGHVDHIRGNDYIDEVFNKQIQRLKEVGVEATREEGIVSIRCKSPEISEQDKQSVLDAIKNNDVYTIKNMGTAALPVLKEALNAQPSPAERSTINWAIMVIEARCMDY